MSGKIADRERRNKVARRKVVEMIAKRLQDKSIVFYHELIARIAVRYRYYYSNGKKLV